MAEQYLHCALELLEYTDIPKLEGRVALLAGLAYHLQQSEDVIKHATRALEISRQVENMRLSQRSYYSTFAMSKRKPQQALETLSNTIVWFLCSTEAEPRWYAFRQQKEACRTNLSHYAGQAARAEKYKLHRNSKRSHSPYSCSASFCSSFVLCRGYIIQTFWLKKWTRWRTDLFTHSRSKSL